MILETPAKDPNIWAEELELLYSMIDRGPGDAELAKKESELQELGRDDREKQKEVLQRRLKPWERARMEKGEGCEGHREGEGQDHMVTRTEERRERRKANKESRKLKLKKTMQVKREKMVGEGP